MPVLEPKSKYERQLEVPGFNKKEIEKIAREACFTFVDLSVLGTFSVEEEIEWNSIEHPEVEPILKDLFDKYDANKITVVKLNVAAGDEKIAVTASDTAIHIIGDGYEGISVIAANNYKKEAGEDEGAKAEGIYPDISFATTTVEIDGVFKKTYVLTLSFYIPEGELE